MGEVAVAESLGLGLIDGMNLENLRLCPYRVSIVM